jgi:cellulose synthase (UDP-forming)
MIPTDREVRLGELVDPAALQGNGYVPGTFRVPFQTFPDLYTWRHRPFPLRLGFRAPPGPVVDLAASHLDVLMNGQFLQSFPLASPDPLWERAARELGFEPGPRDQAVAIPPWMVYGRNELQLAFDARPLDRGACGAIPGDIHMSVDADSRIDLSRAYHFTTLPNLAFLASAGFPFTRLADLSETALVLPERPGAAELGAFLGLMGQFGALTGYPAARLTVLRPHELARIGDRDVILLGTARSLGAAGEMLRAAPVSLDGAAWRVSTARQLQPFSRLFGDRAGDERGRLATVLAASPGEDAAMLVGTERPDRHGRSLVAFLGATPASVAALMDSLRDPALLPLIQGDVALLAGGRITAYRIGPTYTVGWIPFWIWPEFLLSDRPWAVAGLLAFGCLLLATAAYWTLRRRAAQRLFRHRQAQ